MKVLVTGATGFLGSHLCRRMIQEGYDIRILCRPNSNTTIINGLALKRVRGDVTEFESVKRAVRDRDWVIHCAAILGGSKELQSRVNVEGSRNVAKACRIEGVKRLLHVSSVAAIGIPTDRRQPADENFSFNVGESELPYHLSKRRAEQEVMREVTKGLNAVIVNPAFIFGPNGTHYRGVEMTGKVRRNRIVPYFKGGICTVHVHDVTDGIMAALEHGVTGSRYILGGENLTYRSLAEKTSRVLNLRRLFVPIPPLVTGLAARVFERWAQLRDRKARITYADHYYLSRYHFYDSRKARKSLGYTPRDFEAILNECLRCGKR